MEKEKVVKEKVPEVFVRNKSTKIDFVGLRCTDLHGLVKCFRQKENFFAKNFC